MIRRYKSYDGLFSHDKIESSGEDLEPALKDHLSKIGRVEPLIEYWTHEAEKILQDHGYPTDQRALWDALQEGEHAREIHHIRAMLFRLNEVRRAISEQRTEAAVWNMALAVQHGMKAKIRPFEPDVARGQSNVIGGKKGGDTSGRKRREKAELEHSLWQAEAVKIWAKHSKWKKSDVAREILKNPKIDGEFHTIRQFIKKPT